MFLNRRKELAVLSEYLKLIKTGQKVNITLFGLRRIGKTEVLTNFKKRQRGVLMPYLNLQKIVPDLRGFTRHFTAELLREIAAFQGKKTGEPLTIENMLVLAGELGEVEKEHLQALAAAYKQKEIDSEELLHRTFEFPEKLAEKYKMPVVCMVDEFQEILRTHGRMLEIMRATTEKQEKVSYWIAGSVFSVFEDMFDYKKPFFGQFKKMSLENFDRNSSYELADALMLEGLPDNEKEQIFRFTGGHPYYVTALCRRIVQERAITEKAGVKYCMLKELFDSTGMIGEHFNYLLDVGLAKFSNKETYKKILLFLAESPNSLSQTAKEISKTTGETATYLKSLMRTDLIRKRDREFLLRDPVLGFWMKYTEEGALESFPQNEKYADRIISDLQEKYLRAATELGTAKEYELKYRLDKKFGLTLEKYNRYGIELDLVDMQKGLKHIFEIKWRNRESTYNDLKKFVEKIEKSEFAKNTKLYFISKNGFTQEAIKLAEEKRITLLTSKDL